jgi:hypothetical protein
VYLHKSGRLLLRSVSQADSDKVAFTFALPASYKGNATSTISSTTTGVDDAAATAGGAGAGAAAASDGGGKGGAAGAPVDDDDDGRRRRRRRQLLSALHSPSPSSSSSLSSSSSSGSWQRRRAATPEEEALGARVAALWREDGVRYEEARLLQVFEAVVNGGTTAGEGAEEGPSEALGMTLLGDAAAAEGGEEHVRPQDGKVVASVVIPNRAQGQYIRQPSANGRGCAFTVDAHTLPRWNSTQLAEAGAGGVGGEGRKAAAAAEAAAAVVAGGGGEGDGDDDEDAGADAEGEGVETLSSKVVDERMVWAEGLRGTLSAPLCGLTLALESHEAVRLDWGKAYRKAVNYSIVITLVCVLQIALLFRQLYFSRTQAAASRVSLLCIGQQAILDALLCIAHLLLCAALQPLFAAFASIAFFKLVIFSIFEIRYMFIIHQSRNSQSANAVRACMPACRLLVRGCFGCFVACRLLVRGSFGWFLAGPACLLCAPFSRPHAIPTNQPINQPTNMHYQSSLNHIHIRTLPHTTHPNRRASTACGGSWPPCTRASTPSSSSSSSSSTSSPIISRCVRRALCYGCIYSWGWGSCRVDDAVSFAFWGGSVCICVVWLRVHCSVSYIPFSLPSSHHPTHPTQNTHAHTHTHSLSLSPSTPPPTHTYTHTPTHTGHHLPPLLLLGPANRAQRLQGRPPPPEPHLRSGHERRPPRRAALPLRLPRELHPPPLQRLPPRLPGA